MIEDTLVHFKTKTAFNTELEAGNIKDQSITFIKDSKEISTHGAVYKTVNWSVLAKPELYEWVDLGLPSGTLWAAWNVGATKPEEYGLYFAWGETQGYEGVTDDKQFSWSDYKWCNGEYNTLTKYSSDDSFGIIDNLTTLQKDDDAASASGNSLKMPTYDECKELIDNTTSEWTSVNGVNGRLITSTVEGYTDKSIFIPAAGYINNGSIKNVGSNGGVWSSSVDSQYGPCNAHNMCLNSSRIYMYNNDYRYRGFSVRPVKSKS